MNDWTDLPNRLVDDLVDDLVDEIRACPDCSLRPDGRWAFCGWHENVAAAVSAVGRIVAEERK